MISESKSKSIKNNLGLLDHSLYRQEFGVSQMILRFLPLLALYIFIVLIASSNNFQGDEGRYVMYATNLSNGYYSPEGKVYLWNGPGYPIVLLPFVIFKLPWLAAKLLNPMFLFAAVIYFHKTLRFYMQERSALIFSYLLGLYPPFYRGIHLLLTEQLAIYLLCGFMFYFCKLYHENKHSWTHVAAASFYLGYLALTKILFGYVILTGLLLWLCFFLYKKRYVVKRTVLIYFLALLLCMPYLSYTYALTGKIFYWGNSGGISLYLMSTSYEHGYGDWQLLAKHRQEIYEGFNISSEYEIDDEIDKELQRKAVNNIIHNPQAYLKNWVANIGRLLFNYPFSYETQKLSSYYHILPNMFIVCFGVLCLYPTFLARKLIPHEIYALLIFGLIAFGGNSLIYAENRFFAPLVPVFMLWIYFTMRCLITVKVKS